MKNRIQIALTSTLLSVIGHIYLTLHFYPLKFGFAGGQSLCNINAKFDCDAVSASAYSTFLNVPLSIWGAVTNGILFLLILITWLEWTDNPERMRRTTLALSGFSLLASVVMGSISLIFMHNYCLFCIGLYVLSAFTFFSFRGTLREPFWSKFKSDLPKLFQESQGLVVFVAAIPVLAFLMHMFFMQNMGDSKVTEVVEDSIREWQASPQNDFVAKPSMTLGPNREQAALTLVEFADFRCSHCKAASYTLGAFVKSHPDVRLEFYAFPLDGECNEKIQGANGISCRLAGAAYCAETLGKGWDALHILFADQENILKISTATELDGVLAKHFNQLGVNWEAITRCLQDESTKDAIRTQAKQGNLVNVRGTPTIFANGRLLPRANMLPVLSAARTRALTK